MLRVDERNRHALEYANPESTVVGVFEDLNGVELQVFERVAGELFVHYNFISVVEPSVVAGYV